MPVNFYPSADDLLRFSPELTPDQVRGFMEALSDYWRSCGGIGLSVDFQSEEARVAETVNA